MSALTDVLAAQFLNGNVFFLGVAVSSLACAVGALTTRARLRYVLRLPLFLGVLLVLLSGTPLPIWMYAILVLLLAATWIAGAWTMPERTGALAHVLAGLLAAYSLVMAGIEIPRHVRPSIPFPKNKTLFVVGDSLSIGAKPPAENWPEVLGDRAGLHVHNFAFAGATVETAFSNAERIDKEGALVIIEIGGNDLLGGTAVAKFEAGLSELLATVCRAGRRVVMFELPLPPFYNRYGAVQRSLAKSHGVALIPKRCLTQVLATPGATTDGLHLSNTGHALLAKTLRGLLQDELSGLLEVRS